MDFSVSVCVHANVSVSVACLSPNWNLYNATLRQHNMGSICSKAVQREGEAEVYNYLHYTAACMEVRATNRDASLAGP